MAHSEPLCIRAATPEDAPALLEIYRFYVEHTTLTFEYETPTAAQFRSRIAKTLEFYPYLVAESGGEILGYAYAGRFHPRAAYAWTAELSIYLKQDRRRSGLGRRLYTLLEDILRAQHMVKTLARITAPTDAYSDFGSVPFHQRMGCRLSGRTDDLGYKFGRWYALLTMDKRIGQPLAVMPEPLPFSAVREQFAL